MEKPLRTQIYLTTEQRERLDARAKRERRSLAAVIRDAVDQYIAANDVEAALERTFGALPDLEVPSRDEWDREHG